jgi:hypothetical protein
MNWDKDSFFAIPNTLPPGGQEMLDRGCSMKRDLERCVNAFEDPLKMLADGEPPA